MYVEVLVVVLVVGGGLRRDLLEKHKTSWRPDSRLHSSKRQNLGSSSREAKQIFSSLVLLPLFFLPSSSCALFVSLFRTLSCTSLSLMLLSWKEKNREKEKRNSLIEVFSWCSSSRLILLPFKTIHCKPEKENQGRERERNKGKKAKGAERRKHTFERERLAYSLPRLFFSRQTGCFPAVSRPKTYLWVSRVLREKRREGWTHTEKRAMHPWERRERKRRESHTTTWGMTFAFLSLSSFEAGSWFPLNLLSGAKDFLPRERVSHSHNSFFLTFNSMHSHWRSKGPSLTEREGVLMHFHRRGKAIQCTLCVTLLSKVTNFLPENYESSSSSAKLLS